MVAKRLPVIDAEPESLPRRIATGLHKLGLAMKHQGWQQAAAAGLSPTQGQILAALVGEALTATELGERLGLTLPTISDSVRALVDKGLVTREPDPRHPRARLLVPTTAGRTAGDQARAWPELFADALTDLDADEQRGLYAGLIKVIRTLQERGQVPLSGMCVTCTYFRPRVRTGASPHHCALIDAPLAAIDLRLDCPEHELAADDVRRALWAQLTGPA